MLIFDSGVGGLFVLHSIKKILPNIHYIYLLDNEAFPYGNKKEFFIIERSIKIISKIKKIYPIKIVVIACNTVSTISLSVLRKKFNLPIFGILPSIKYANKKTTNKIIGLIATKATINSFYIKNIINQKYFYNILKIIGTNKLASIAEKKIRGISISKKELKKIFKPWINIRIKPDIIILGCTHFSSLREEIKTILYTSSIHFIDPREKLVLTLQKYFNNYSTKQEIKNNIFLYSKNNKELEKLFFCLKKYKFSKIQHINLNQD